MPTGVYERKPLEHHILEQRFFDNTERIPECGCWIWMGFVASKNGYGQYNREGKTLLAHRVAFEFKNGVIPKGLHVRHRCNMQTCVNPAHLLLGTHTDNMADRRAAGKYGGQYCGASIPAEIVFAIREKYIPEIYTARKLAMEFGISKSQVLNIIHHRQRVSE